MRRSSRFRTAAVAGLALYVGGALAGCGGADQSGGPGDSGVDSSVVDSSLAPEDTSTPVLTVDSSEPTPVPVKDSSVPETAPAPTPSCTGTCTTNAECASTCTVSSGEAACCDTATKMCYVASSACSTTPTPSGDASMPGY